MNRRSFLAVTASAVCAAAKPKPKTFNKPLGAELYTVREQLPKDPDGVLQALSQIGYVEVEAARADVDKISGSLSLHGLSLPAIHFEAELVLGGESKTVPDGYTWPNVLELAGGRGIHYVVLAYIPKPLRGDADAFKRIADKMNRAADDAAKAGVQFCYHNHAFEFEGKQGQRPWDILLDRWDKKLVQLELDAFWLSVAGNDPADMIRDQGSRVALLHLKDKAFGTPVQYDEGLPHNDFMAVGTGTLDWVRILHAAEAAGVQHYFVEQDYTPGPPLESLRISYANLRKVKV